MIVAVVTADVTSELRREVLRPAWPVGSVMHGEDDPANMPADCERLAATLGKTASVRRVAFGGASYAWDVPLRGEGVYSRQPWPGGQGTVLVRSWPELADQTAAQTAAFLANTLSKGEAP